MRKLFLFLVFVSLTVSSVQSADRYAIYVEGEYGYNVTYRHGGGAEVKAVLPINPHFEMQVVGEVLSVDMYTVGTTLRPKFQLPVGEMFVDGTLFYQAMPSFRLHDFVGAASVGYRMDYVSAQFGFFTQGTWNLDSRNAEGQGSSVDMFNFLYKVQVNVRPSTSPWNLGVGVSNYTDCQYDHAWQPLFYLTANYDLPLADGSSAIDKTVPVNERHWRLFTELLCKPTGIFSQQAAFYSISLGLGFAYMF